MVNDAKKLPMKTIADKGTIEMEMKPDVNKGVIDREKRNLPKPRYDQTLFVKPSGMIQRCAHKSMVKVRTPSDNIGAAILYVLHTYGKGKVSPKLDLKMIHDHLECAVNSRRKDGSKIESELIPRYMIRGKEITDIVNKYHEYGATTPSYARKKISKVLSELGGLVLSPSGQTTSWLRMLGPKVHSSSFMVFFIITPHEMEDLYNVTLPNNGEYLQAAVLDNETRLFAPCNVIGTGFILGKDVETLCKNGTDQSVTDWLNTTKTWQGIQGIYPFSLNGRCEPARGIRLAGVYEISELPRYEEYNPWEHTD